MQYIIQTPEGKKLYNEKLEIYGDGSKVDAMEETFVDMFSNWVMGRYASSENRINKMFKENIDVVKNTAQSLYK